MMTLLRNSLALCLLLTYCHGSESAPAVLDAVCFSDSRSLSDIRMDSSRILSELQREAKAVLIINTASFCAYTHQYPGFNELQIEFGNDLAILGFPCNQFGLQEPGVGVEIPNTLRFVRPGGGYVPNFYLSKKIEVNGPKAHELFVELKRACPPVKTTIGISTNLYWEPVRVGDITWNFNKFLLDRRGVPYKRYDSSVEPANLKADIARVIRNAHTMDARPKRPKYAMAYGEL